MNHILGEEEQEIPLEHKVISLSVIMVMIFFRADFAIKALFPFLLFFCLKACSKTNVDPWILLEKIERALPSLLLPLSVLSLSTVPRANKCECKNRQERKAEEGTKLWRNQEREGLVETVRRT